MTRNISKLLAVLVLSAVAGVASADGDSGDSGDSSMNPYTGDSWAALQGGGHNLGDRRGLVTVRIAKARDTATSVAGDQGQATAVASGARRGRTNRFRNDKDA